MLLKFPKQALKSFHETRPALTENSTNKTGIIFTAASQENLLINPSHISNLNQ